MSEHPALNPKLQLGAALLEKAVCGADTPRPDVPVDLQAFDAPCVPKKRSRKLRNKCGLCGEKLSARRVSSIYLVTFQCDTCKACICHSCSCDRTKHKCLQAEIDAALETAGSSIEANQDKIARKLDRV